MPPPGPVEAAQGTDVVFHGKLLAVADAPHTGQYDIPSKMFTFEVVRTFKGHEGGQLDGQVRLSTADNSAACGRSFGELGSEWLVYARVEDSGSLHDNLCSRTRSLAQAAADIAELEANADALDDEPPKPNYEVPADPGPADPEPAPLIPSEEGGEGGAPVEPQPSPKPQRCAVSDPNLAGGGFAGLFGLGLALAYLRRRR